MSDGLAVRKFQAQFGVSRETIDRFSLCEALIQKWNSAINLIAKSTLDDIWQRHFTDSAAAYQVADPRSGLWVDLGTGGGFPGLVVAILASELAPDLSVTCIESDIRKCEFLRTTARNLGLSVGIISRRIEETPPQEAQFVSARALAPLSRLLDHAHRHIANDGCAILLKGETWRAEVETALESWRFTVENHASPTNPGAAILKIGNLARA